MTSYDNVSSTCDVKNDTVTSRMSGLHCTGPLFSNQYWLLPSAAVVCCELGSTCFNLMYYIQ